MSSIGLAIGLVVKQDDLKAQWIIKLIIDINNLRDIRREPLVKKSDRTSRLGIEQQGICHSISKSLNLRIDSEIEWVYQ